MNGLAKRILAQDALPQVHRARPLFVFLRDSGQRLQLPQVLFAIIRALLLHPGLITALHKLASIKRGRPLVTVDTFIKLARAPGSLAIGNQPLELFRIDAVVEIRVQLIVAFAINEKVLFQRLVAVKAFADVRNRWLEILLHDFLLSITPECIDNRTFRSASMPAQGYEAENVSRASLGA